MVPRQKRKLNIDYVIYKDFYQFTQDEKDYLTSVSTKLTNKNSIFNGTKNDKKRLQKTLKKEKLFSFLNAVKMEIDKINPEFIFSNLVLLKSLSGCQKQQFHTDIIIDEKFNLLENKPYACLFAVQDNTKLYLFEDNQEKLIILNQGDLIIFSLDLYHAGADYDTENIRIHFYLDLPTYHRKLNRIMFLEK